MCNSRTLTVGCSASWPRSSSSFSPSVLSIFIVKNTPAAPSDLQLFDSEKSQCAVQLSALSDGISLLHDGSNIAVAAKFSIGLTEPRHRQFGAIALPVRAPRRRQDSVRSVVLD